MSVRPGTWAIVAASPPQPASRYGFGPDARGVHGRESAHPQQCASDDFEIDRVTVERVAGCT